MGHLEPQICVDPKTCVLWTSPALRGPICRFRRHCGLLPGTSCGSQGHLLELKSTRAVARNFGTCLDVERPFYTLWHRGQKLLPVFSRAVFFWKKCRKWGKGAARQGKTAFVSTLQSDAHYAIGPRRWPMCEIGTSHIRLNWKTHLLRAPLAEQPSALKVSILKTSATRSRRDLNTKLLAGHGSTNIVGKPP